VFVAALLWALLHGRRLRWPDWQLRPLDVPLILLLMVPVVFVFSGFGGQGINPWGFDATSRYSIHLWPPLAVVLGAFVAYWWPRGRWLAALLGAGVLVFNGYSIARTDAVQAFQSPYWEKLPADNSDVLAVLHQQGVNAIWANHWAGYVLMFDARANGDRLIAYDWYDVAAGGMDRFPDDRARVVDAPKTAFVLVTDEEDPELAQRLRDLGVTYDLYHAEPYVVVIPTSRIVQPTEVLQSLDYRY
jgi:hypothetical protein